MVVSLLLNQDMIVRGGRDIVEISNILELKNKSIKGFKESEVIVNVVSSNFNLIYTQI